MNSIDAQTIIEKTEQTLIAYCKQQGLFMQSIYYLNNMVKYRMSQTCINTKM